jgi:ATP-dependent DNA helicase RecQ
VVIDEAHCISDWGFDFRPDYQRLARTLLGIGADTPVLATTATANQPRHAGRGGQLGAGTRTFRGTLARSSLRLAVVPGWAPLQRYAWVADALRRRRARASSTPSRWPRPSAWPAFLAGRATRWRPTTAGWSRAARQRVEDALRDNRLKAVVATSALGMGYDKPDLAFCIHVGSPASPVAYYQQVGRAGRALDDADGRAAAGRDRRTPSGPTSPPPACPTGAWARCWRAAEGGPLSLPALETATGIRRGRLEGC